MRKDGSSSVTEMPLEKAKARPRKKDRLAAEALGVARAIAKAKVQVKTERKANPPVPAKEEARNLQDNGLQNGKIRFKLTTANDNAEQYVEKLLNEPPVMEGGRHEDILRRSLQLVANGWTDGRIYDAIERIYPIGSGDSRKVTEREILDAIRGARAKSPTPTGSNGNSGHGSNDTKPTIEVRRYEPANRAEALPTDLANTTPIQFLNRIFNPGELVCINLPDDDGTARSKRLWLTLDGSEDMGEGAEQFTTACESHDAGVWFVINPMKSNANREDANVADFRYLLVEMDKKGGDKETQFSNLKNSGLPIAAIYDSGNKSIHGLVRIDAKDAAEFRQRQEIVYAYLEKMGIDPQCKNPARISRLPGCRRGDSRQTLLTWAVGAKSWQEWEDSQDSTEWFSNRSLRTFDRKEDPNSLIGNRWLCSGGSLVIQGYSGIGKSSFALQMALHWAVGKDFFGIPVKRPLRTVFIQAENDHGDFAEAFQDITAAFS
jgi:hypothetical protein